MKMKTGKEGRRLSCDVWTAKELKFQTEIPCSLESDAVGYAACRFLTKCEILCRDYVEQSYRLRLKQGKGRRSVRSRFTAPARMMDERQRERERERNQVGNGLGRERFDHGSE